MTRDQLEHVIRAAATIAVDAVARDFSAA